MPRTVVTLTTDFGSDSPYVGEMKAAILSTAKQYARELEIVDITHSVEPQNVEQAAYLLAHITPQFPAGSYHLAVIDPGVGTGRRILAARIHRQSYVCPDNGLLTRLLQQAETHGESPLHSVENGNYFRPAVSVTFHGRDIMAPVVTHWACGVEAAEFGPPVADPVRLEFESARISEKGNSNPEVDGRILWSDSFGNLVSNVTRGDLERILQGRPASEARVQISGAETLLTLDGISRAYGESEAGSWVALIGSSDLLEIAVVNGNARSALARELQLEAGADVRALRIQVALREGEAPNR